MPLSRSPAHDINLTFSANGVEALETNIHSAANNNYVHPNINTVSGLPSIDTILAEK